MIVNSFSSKLKKNVHFLEKCAKREKKYWLINKGFELSYCYVSSFLLYLKSRVFFSKNELNLLFRTQKPCLKLNTSSREQFVIFSYFSYSSFFSSLSIRIEYRVGACWPKHPLKFGSEKIQRCGAIRNQFMHEYENCILTNPYDIDEAFKNTIHKYFLIYLEFLDFYVKLLNLRFRLIQRLQKSKNNKQSLLNFLLELDKFLFLYNSQLALFSYSLLEAKLQFIKESKPTYIKYFKKDSDAVVDQVMEEALSDLLDVLDRRKENKEY